MTQIIRALSIRQPWLHFITQPASAAFPSPKRVENRTQRNGRAGQPCRHRGPLLLHASGSCSRREYDAALESCHRAGVRLGTIPPPSELPLGGIVAYCQAIGHLRPDGTADTVYGKLSAREVHSSFDLRWWQCGHALLLDDVEPVPFVACPGALNTWRVSAPVLAELERRGYPASRLIRHAETP